MLYSAENKREKANDAKVRALPAGRISSENAGWIFSGLLLASLLLLGAGRLIGP